MAALFPMIKDSKMNALTFRQLPSITVLFLSCFFRPGPESESHWEGCKDSGGHFASEDGEDQLRWRDNVMEKGNGTMVGLLITEKVKKRVKEEGSLSNCYFTIYLVSDEAWLQQLTLSFYTMKISAAGWHHLFLSVDSKSLKDMDDIGIGLV